MKRFSLMLGLLIATLGMQAQQYQHSNYIGVGFGGGVNSLLYSPADGSLGLGFGFTATPHYIHFFGKHFGFGLGVQYTHAHASATYDFTEVTPGLTHPDNGLLYDLHTVYDGWREHQTMSFFSVPVELYWRCSMSERWDFLFGLGAQLDIPLSGNYSAEEGNFRTEGYFPSVNQTVSDLPDHGFRTYNADHESDFSFSKLGVSLIADLGFNYALSNHWGLYMGIYASYGLTNILDSTSTQPLLAINESDASQLDYNGTLLSNQIESLRLLNVGVKLGINIGWNCHGKKNASDEPQLESYNTKQSSDKPADKVTNDKPADKVTNDKPADNVQPKQVVDNNVEEAISAEEDAAREARCNARRMNNPDLAQAINNIEHDIDEAAQEAEQSGNEAALNSVADARAKAADAKTAHRNGQYCKAYDMMIEAYAALADSYSDDAESFASKVDNPAAKQHVEAAALYADAAHKDGLDCAMASSRNAKINADAILNLQKGKAYADPNVAKDLATAALALANESGSKDGVTAAKDASGKAYRGEVADSYAAAARSFASSAKAYADKCPTAKTAAADAERYASESATATRLGDAAMAYRCALRARDAATTASSLCNNAAPAAAAAKPAARPSTDAPVDRAQLQSYLDRINATVHFDFGSTEPRFDNQTELAINALCAAMKANSNVKILITGHTDNVGSAEGNMTYGKKRAEALKQLMVGRGAPAASISTASKGQSEPVVDNDTDEHRYQNRRAVITLR